MRHGILSMDGRSPKAVLIYVTGDFTRLRSGSHVRFDQMVRYALENFDRVIVYSFRDNAEDPWTQEAEARFHAKYGNAELVVEIMGRRLKNLFRVKNLALMMAPHRAAEILRLRIRGATPEYEKLTQGLDAPAMLINFADGLCQLNGIDLRSVSVDTHDSKYVRYAKFRRLSLSSWKSLLRLRSEIGMLGQAGAVIAISQAEAGFFRVLFGAGNVLLIPIFTKANTIEALPAEEARCDLLFVGSDNIFNRDGIKSFIRQFGDELDKITLKVAGSVCSDPELQQIAAQYDNITLLGWVDDIKMVYDGSKVVIAPVDGTGLNIKVVEALEHGRPVVASPHVRNALPGDHSRCVFPVDAKNILALVSDPAQLQSAEREARAYAQSPVLRGDLDQLTMRLLMS